MNPKIYYGNGPAHGHGHSHGHSHRPAQPYFARQNDMPERRDTILSSKRMQVERKSFTLEVRENHRGRFLSVVEEGRSRSMIIVPSEGLAEFKALLNEVIATAEKAAPAPAPAAAPAESDVQSHAK